MSRESIAAAGKYYAEFDENGTMTNVVYDESYRALLGFDADNYSDTNEEWENSIHPDDADRLDALYADFCEKHPEGMDFEAEYRMRTKHGYRWFHDYAKCKRREDGSILYCDGVVFDIQDAMEKSDERQLLAENSARILALEDDFVSFYDLDLETGEYELHIKEQARDHGVNDVMVKGDNFFEDAARNVLVVAHPEDRDGILEVLDADYIREALEKDGRFDYYYRLLVDDAFVWARLRMVYKDAGKRNVIIGTFNAENAVEAQQIAEQKERLQEQQIRNDILHEVSNAITWSYEIGADDEIVSYSYADQADGIVRSDGFEGNPMAWADVVHPDDRDAAVEAFETAIRDHAGDTPYNSTYRIMGADGGYVWLKVAGRMHRREDGTGEMFGISMDITEQMEAQKARLLGAVPISPDVLEKANIGLWAFEMDEGQPPRMYGDATMIKLVGLDRQVPPEEMYHAWYDHIDEGSYDLVAEAVEKMSSGTHAEVQYPWHHPDGRTMIVRCGGVRNPEYTKGMRIEGTHQDVSATLHYDEEEIALRRQMNMIYSLSDEFDPIMILDPESGEYSWHQSLAQEVENLTSMSIHGFDFYGDIAKDVSINIHEEDRSRFSAFYAKENMARIARIGETQETENRWRIGQDGTYRWKYNKVVRMVDEDGRVLIVVGVIDTTEQREREARLDRRLREAEDAERLAESVAGAYSLAFAAGMAGASFKVIRANERAREVLGTEGFESYAAAVSALLEVIHPADRERMAREFDFNVIKGKLEEASSYTCEYRVIENGVARWHEMDVTHIGSDEVVMGFAEKDLEITKRHLDEERFSEYFGLYEADLDAGLLKVLVDSPYYTFSETGEPVPYSSAMRVFAESQKDETREYFLNIADIGWLKDTLSVDNRYAVTYFSITAGDTWVSVTCYVTARHDDGTPAMVALGFSFVSSAEAARQELQKRLNEANESNELVLSFINGIKWSYFINEEDEIVAARYGDSAAESYDESHLGGPMDWVELVHPDDRELAVEDFMDTVRDRSGEKTCDITYRLMGTDGNYHWTKVAARVFPRENGLRELFGISVDVSDQMDKEREQQKQLGEALSMAESANRAKTTFLNNMSHDIRTPMNAIIGYTGLAASHIDNKEQVQDYLGKIAQSSDHLLSLINDVLDMSRIESGKMNLDEAPENLSDIIHTLRDIVQADIRSKQLDFFVDAVDVNDENVVCDKLRLNQVLLNILSNSIKYTPAGGTVIMRVTEKAVKPSGYATYEFCVRDNGMGMEPEFLKTIFDPFTRVSTATVTGIQGTGLGMSITKNIVDMMGGTIDIQSEPGKGTEVTMTFDFMLQSAPKAPEQIPELKGMRALVADDDSNTCLSICNMVEDIGMRCEWCTSGKEAVIRAGAAYQKGDLFRVYIIDWIMPDMNGIETTRRIRKVIGDDAPIIILTAYDWSDIEEEAREAGVTAFVSKPMFPSDLHRVLNRCLDKEEEPAPEAPTFDFAGKRVLLVEDNELNREIAQEILEESGFVVEAVEDGDIAVERMRAAQTGDFDLVLMDIQMPRMDGYEATRQIRALGNEASRIPILAMTANAFEEDRKAALAAGMDEHIAKPIDVGMLRETLARFLR